MPRHRIFLFTRPHTAPLLKAMVSHQRQQDAKALKLAGMKRLLRQWGLAK